MNVCQGWCTWRGRNRSYEEKCWSYKRRFWKDTGGPVNCWHCSVTKLYLTVCDPMDCSMPGSSVFHCLPGVFKFIFIESVMLSNHLIFCHPLLLPSIFPASASFLMSRFFTAGGQSIGASASVLPMSPSNQPFRVDFLKDWPPWSPYCPKDSQESSPVSKLESINCNQASMVNNQTRTSTQTMAVEFEGEITKRFLRCKSHMTCQFPGY